ncbi:hypothetical protein HGRIS_009979 [Hohenbuehelia grisea]|uniref:Uncharacterized protein n=1 Tax=Hohenbuehelia grisea TaxID=104357 RepID=A0ABR3J2X0_9AGAR
MDPLSSEGSLTKSGSSSGPFAYQTRLLERTSSRAGSISRTNSLSNRELLTHLTGNDGPTSPTQPTTRRRLPTHRVSNSLESFRKWEERIKAEDDSQRERERSASPTKFDSRDRYTSVLKQTTGGRGPSPERNSVRGRWPDDDRAPTPPPKDGSRDDSIRTPTMAKRYTMPSPIISSPLSPNNTGITVEAGPSLSSFGASSSTPVQQIRLPSSTPFKEPTMPASAYRVPKDGVGAASSSTRVVSPPSRYRRSNTVDTPPSNWARPQAGESSTTTPAASTSAVNNDPPPPSPSPNPLRRPTSLYGSLATPSSPVQVEYKRPFSSTSAASSTASTTTSFASSSTDVTSTSSVMSPAPYRSSYMANKKSTYGSALGTGRKLGRHLPRIASGDGDEHWEAEEPKPYDSSQEPNEYVSRREKRERRVRDWGELEVDSPTKLTQFDSPTKTSQYTPTSSSRHSYKSSISRRHSVDLVSPSIVVAGSDGAVPTGDDVAGIPGRMRLSRDMTPKPEASPLPSARFTRGLWADVQRQHIQAYEYLCHVGEAQQWIEGCLGEELGFGVVEMEDNMRNGVVLAKLVRSFNGEIEGVVLRPIYDAPKLNFRHSDNINYFFDFVRFVIGLPECFIFELTDLYEKKNFPKVIYCIHALSHLMARRGMAERIGNLVGQLNFTDDQLQKTHKGLKDAGVAMPNFGNVGRELAKEINEEPEETEEERIHRTLLEHQDSIIAAQALFRGFLVRKAQSQTRMRIRLAERYIPKIQAQCHAVLARRRLQSQRKEHSDLGPWAVALQAAARGAIARRQWLLKLRRIRASAQYVVKVQAQLRGILQRRRFAKLKAALRKSSFSVVKLQSIVRARISRNAHAQLSKSFERPPVFKSIVTLQASARGALERRRQHQRALELTKREAGILALQAHCRGVLVRRRFRSQLAKLEDVSQTVVRIQAAVRTYLARKRLLTLIRGLRRATPMVVGLQALMRAKIARQKHVGMQKALTEVKTVTVFKGLQAIARASLAKKRHQEIRRELEFHNPDMVGLQASVRGALVRVEYRAWRDHLRRSHPAASMLQALLRGVMQRRKFRAKMDYYRTNLSKVVKIQSLFRAKETREQYRQLTMATNVTTGTIKNFVHLLDDSEADFQEEIKIERLRKRVVENIRENQLLESEVNDLDTMIALVVQNVMSFEEVMRARRSGDSATMRASRASLLAAHGDPFSGQAALDHTTKRKLELYQQLFYLLQTKADYLSKLFLQLSPDDEKNKKFIERVVLTLFGYGQDRREDYLLLKLFQLAIRDEVNAAHSLEDIIHGHPLYINIAVHYVRPKQVTYAREALQAVIREVIESDDLDLEADPILIHRSRIDVEEMKSGVPSEKPKEVPFYEALNDPDTRAEYIRHLQVLQWWTEGFVTALTQSAKKMPYGMRFLARETLLAIRERFPNASEEEYAACIARLVYYRYINPAIITPETFDIVSKTIDIASRKNLAQISKILTQITSGSEFTDAQPNYIPINDYVNKAIGQMTAWLLEVADVPDAETTFQASEFLDATAQPKPIYISPNEIYTVHGLLVQHQDELAPEAGDTLRVILNELDGVPHFATEELKDAREHTVALELTNRFAHIRDPEADEKALWVQAKRGVLAILRVHPAQELVEALMRPVTEEDELLWAEILDNEIENEQHRHVDRRMPSTAGGDSAYNLEDIRSLKFAAVKALTISYLLDLENIEKISRADGFQGILNAIAGDVRSKHRKRLQRQQEMANMHEALRQLAERKQYYTEQINSYHDYVERSMNTMQQGKAKKRLALPFTPQWNHLRDLQKAGYAPQFGSFLYKAKYLYEKGILLSVESYSPRQFDKIHLTISSDAAGVFSLLLESSVHGVMTRVAADVVRMSDLLKAQWESKASYSLFNGIVKVNLTKFLYQINKKFNAK